MIFSDGIHILHYDIVDTIMLIFASFGGIIGLLFSGLACKYTEASKLGPFYNLEVVFLCILESLLLSYQFTLTDILGGTLIITALLVSIIKRS